MQLQQGFSEKIIPGAPVFCPTGALVPWDICYYTHVMEEIIKLIEEAKFMDAVRRILSLPDNAQTKGLCKSLAEVSGVREQFQIREYAWTRAVRLRVRMNLILKP
ncbi:MAG: hypothetical protein Q7I97_09810 [Thermovirgaceae bacterium]|nr:hypothetical protein [Thermovirgaceae bacterium]